MCWTLEKCSLPDVWSKQYENKDELINRFRCHICKDCKKEVDYEYNGQKFLCRDLIDLLSTSCGLEFEIYEYGINIKEIDSV